VAEKFYYGASYSPLVFPESDWARDLALMQQAGMNLIRLGDVHGSWDLIEPRPGEYQLDTLDRFYRKAAEYGIDILISTGASGPPLWLAQKYPDVTLLNSRGERYPLGASYHWVCISHPGYRSALVDYIQKLLEFTAKHDNHFGWQITNEIGFPFLPPRGEDSLNLFCYCDDCQSAFQNWVQNKYGTLEDLTKAWAWGTTYYVYNDWSEVFPPESPPSAWASVTRWLDWRRFWQFAFSNFAGWQHQMLKEKDPDHPTSINTFNFKGYDRFGVYTGLDQWQLAEKVDHIGYDLYPGSGNKLVSRPEHTSMFLDHGRSVAQTTGRDFWLHEIESGPIGGWVMGPDHRTDALDIHQYCVESLGHNAKLMLYMPWREWDYQPLHWGALVDLDGNPTPRLTAAGEIGGFLRDHGEKIMAASVSPSQTAILESKKNAIFFNGVNQDEDLFVAQRGAYRALWEKGYNVDFINPKILNQGSGASYRQIMLPMMGLIDRNTAQSLAEYVNQGGLLLGFARCATLDGRGWFYHQNPYPPLGETFGITKIDPDLLEDQQIHFDGNIYKGYWNRDILALKPETEILATFTDGQPAVTLHPYGKGFACYIATQADMAHIKESPSLLSNVLSLLHERIGLTPRVSVVEPEIKIREIDPHILDLPSETFLLVTDYLNETKQVKMVLNDSRKAKNAKIIFPVPQPLNWHQQDEQLSFGFTNQPKEVKIIQIDWQA